MDFQKRVKLLGPGLIYAGAAVGVSHLVQSTRAGATFGFALLGAVLLANIFKYTSFEFSARYVSATGENLLHGYRKLGMWAVVTFFVMSFFTMFTIQAAVTIVTAGVVENLTSIHLGATWWSFILLLVSGVLLYSGQYKYLDRGAKIIIVILSIATVISLALSFSFGHTHRQGEVFNITNIKHFAFLVALVGWMPSPIDISIWSSLWSVEKNNLEGRRLTLQESLFDFRVGYIGTIVLAVCFIGLGANAFYGSGETLASSSVQFAAQLISMYTKTLGSWSAPFISLAAFLTMFSTTITCLDAFPRVMRAIAEQTGVANPNTKKRDYLWALLLIFIVTMIILTFFVKNMRGMVDFATTISFITAPVFALLNYLVVTKKDFPAAFSIKGAYKLFAFVSVIVLFLFMFSFIGMKIWA